MLKLHPLHCFRAEEEYTFTVPNILRTLLIGILLTAVRNRRERKTQSRDLKLFPQIMINYGLSVIHTVRTNVCFFKRLIPISLASR